MTTCKRAIDIVDIVDLAIEPLAYEFRGKRFGFTPGCWIVSSSVALTIAQCFGINRLPRMGYDMALEDGHYENMMTNEAGRYRVTLTGDKYRYKFTGKFG